jgi:type I restriction enzyme S subunit
MSEGQFFSETKRQRFQPYPKYKDSGVEWLGEIPAHWEIKSLKLISSINMGQSPPSDIVNTSGEGLPFLQGNADFGAVHPTAQTFCPSPPKIAELEDILLSVRAPVGALNIADRKYGIGRGLCAVHPAIHVLEREYCHYVLQIARCQLDAVAKGSTYDAVSADDVSSLLMLLPSIIEQHKIAAFLDRETVKIDTLIGKNERLIELLQEKRIALITEAVTKGLDPNVPMKDSGIEWLGIIPAHWDVVPIYARYDVSLGKMLDAKRVTGEHLGYYLRNVDVQWDRINIGDLPQMDFAPYEDDRYLLSSGDLLVCEGGEAGRSAIWHGELEKCFYQKAIHRARPLEKSQIPRFLFYLIYAMATSGVFEAGGNPNTINHLTAVQLRHLRVPFPPSLEQRTLVAFLDQEMAKVDALVVRISEAIERLKEYRIVLISAAVTGKIDVRRTSDKGSGLNLNFSIK